MSIAQQFQASPKAIWYVHPFGKAGKIKVTLPVERSWFFRWTTKLIFGFEWERAE